MPDQPPKSTKTGAAPTSAGPPSQADQALWRLLAEATTVEQFGQAWLGLQARMIGGATGGLVVLERAETGPMEAVALWPQGYLHAQRLSGVVERALRERKGIVTRLDGKAETEAADDPTDDEAPLLLAFPIAAGNKIQGVAAFEISPRPQIQLQTAMRQLQWGAAWLQNWVLRRSVDPGKRLTKRAATALELAGLALEERRFKSAATGIVTELASRLDCDRVSIGFVSGKQVKVQALSHSAQFGKEMNLIRSIGMAMGESVDQAAVLLWPETGPAGHHVLHAHEALARTHGDGAILTVPFLDPEDKAFGALTLERAASEPFDPAAVELCDSLAALLGPILEEKRKNDRLLVVKAADSLRTQAERLLGPRYVARKLIAGALVALVLFFTFARGQYRVTAEATLEGEIRRVVTAPFRGFIFEAPVRGGDIVRAGQTMCSLDVRDLRLEYSRWSSEREQYAAEHRRAMATGDRAAMNVLNKKMGQAEAQIALLDEQLSRATIVAPFDGLVVNGDLSQALGSPVEPGEVLFEVAPLESYRVALKVDEREIGDVEVGQTGELTLTALPETRFGFTVTKVTPVSQTKEGVNYFAVEATLGQVTERLRPGMQGFGKVDVDRRRLIWIWTHKLFDWLRIKLWTWLP